MCEGRNSETKKNKLKIDGNKLYQVKKVMKVKKLKKEGNLKSKTATKK